MNEEGTRTAHTLRCIVVCPRSRRWGETRKTQSETTIERDSEAMERSKDSKSTHFAVHCCVSTESPSQGFPPAWGMSHTRDLLCLPLSSPQGPLHVDHGPHSLHVPSVESSQVSATVHACVCTPALVCECGHVCVRACADELCMRAPTHQCACMNLRACLCQAGHRKKIMCMCVCCGG